MILVDSSVWIDYFNGISNPQSDHLDGILGREPVAVGDLILLEVLQGFRDDGDYRTALSLLGSLLMRQLLDPGMAIVAAAHYRSLRKRGTTIRRTTDLIIGSYCIENRIPLLYSDRDFDPMVTHLGLMSALEAP